MLPIHPGSPANQTGFTGFSTGRLNTGNIFEGQTMAHEIGHSCNLKHAPCGTTHDLDPDYPIYPGYPSASIGEFGFDTTNSLVFDPMFVVDFMSTCGGWVSPYTYEKLMNCFPPISDFVSEIIGQVPVEVTQNSPRKLLFLSCMIYRDGVVILKEPNFCLDGVQPIPLGDPTPYFIELHNKNGRILEAQRLKINDFHKSLDDAYLNFFTTLPWHAEAGQLVFKREDTVVHSIKIKDTIPKVEIVFPKGGETLTGKQRVIWNASSSNKPLNYTLRYSYDGGVSWIAVTTGLTENEYVVNMDNLPGGENCVFQILASEGILTSKATSVSFIVPHKPYKPLIILPQNKDLFVIGEPVHLFGAAHSPKGSADPNLLNLASSIDGYLGSGSQLIVHTLSVGRHCITLSINDDSCGDEVSTSRNIIIRPKE